MSCSCCRYPVPPRLCRLSPTTLRSSTRPTLKTADRVLRKLVRDDDEDQKEALHFYSVVALINVSVADGKGDKPRSSDILSCSQFFPLFAGTLQNHVMAQVALRPQHSRLLLLFFFPLFYPEVEHMPNGVLESRREWSVPSVRSKPSIPVWQGRSSLDRTLKEGEQGIN